MAVIIRAPWTFENIQVRKTHEYEAVRKIIMTRLETLRNMDKGSVKDVIEKLIWCLGEEHKLMPSPKAYIKHGIHFRNQSTTIETWYRAPRMLKKQPTLLSAMTDKVTAFVEEQFAAVLSGQTEIIAEHVLRILADDFLLAPSKFSKFPL
jgi:hypothetical protein